MPEAQRLILASQSPYRRAQLKSLGISHLAQSPLVNEEELKTKRTEPQELAAFLSEQKAISLKSQYPSDWILGADQLVNFKGEILGKTPDFDRARAQLQKLQGESHELITSFCLVGPTQTFRHTDITQMHMRKLSLEEIEAYLKQDEPYDCAGTYKLEKAGISLFKRIESKDFTAIQGLPLIAFSQIWLEATGKLPFRD